MSGDWLRRLAASPGAALFALALVSYAYFYQAGGWNQNTRFAMVRAVVEDGSARIDRFHRATGDKSKRGDHYYSDKAPGSSWLGVPAYAAARAAMGEEPSGRRADAAAYVVTVWAVGFPSALAVAALYGLLGFFGLGVATRIAAATAYGLGTLAFPFATLYYGHQLTAALVILGLYLLVRGSRSPGMAVWLFASGLSFGYAIAVEYPTALAVIPCLLYAAWRVRPLSRLGWIAIGLALPGLAVAAYHAVAFGGPLTLPYEYSTQPHRHQGVFMGLGVPSLEALRAILVSGYRGLLFSAPWLALAAPGAWLWWRRGLRGEAALWAIVPVLFVWMNASLVDWEGGWTFGPRYLIPAIPFLAMAAAGLGFCEGGGRAGRGLVWATAIALVAVSIAMMLAATAVKPEVPVTIERPYGEYLWPHVLRGELAVSTQSIESPAAPPGGPRYAWNAGQLLGLPGLASLLPLFALWAAGGAWLARAARRSIRPGAARASPSR